MNNLLSPEILPGVIKLTNNSIKHASRELPSDAMCLVFQGIIQDQQDIINYLLELNKLAITDKSV